MGNITDHPQSSQKEEGGGGGGGGGGAFPEDQAPTLYFWRLNVSQKGL